jgi:hypothetical protein
VVDDRAGMQHHGPPRGEPALLEVHVVVRGKERGIEAADGEDVGSVERHVAAGSVQTGAVQARLRNRRPRRAGCGSLLPTGVWEWQVRSTDAVRPGAVDGSPDPLQPPRMGFRVGVQEGDDLASSRVDPRVASAAQTAVWKSSSRTGYRRATSGVPSLEPSSTTITS